MTCIAVIEDDEPVLDAIQLLLEMQGWTVRTYTGGEVFLVDLERYQPACVILDPHLRGISGIDVARVVSSKASVPIICLTAQPDSPTTKAVERLGVHVTLTKPVSAETLIHHLQAVLSKATSEPHPGQ